MTYLITSNTQKTGSEINTTGINAPASYVNMLSQTFEIEKDSEVAVESIKITRNGNLQISSVNNKFGIYIGENPNKIGTDQGIPFRTGFCVPTRISGGNITKSPTDLCYNIREGLLQGLGQHPNFLPIDTTFPKVELKNGSNEFTGFKYSFTQNKESEKTPIPATAGDGWVASTKANINATVSASGSAGAVKLNKDGSEELYGNLSVIGQKYPLNLANGSVVFCFNSSLNGSAGDLWEVGLTRATFNEEQVDSALAGAPEHFKPGQSGFNYFDYSVRPNFINGSFEIFCSAVSLDGSLDTPEGGRHKVLSIPNVSLTQGKGTASAFNRVKIIAKNEGLIFQLLSFNGSITTLLDTSSVPAGDRDNTVKPIGISNFYLYPKVNILSDPSASCIMVIDGYDGLNIPSYRFSQHNNNASFQYGGRFRGEALTPSLLGFKCDGDLTYQDFYATSIWKGESGVLSIYESRYPFNYGFEQIEPHAPKGLNGCATTSSQVLDRDIIIVSSEDDAINGEPFLSTKDIGEDDLTFVTPQAFQLSFRTTISNRFGAQNILGFENVSVQEVVFTDGVIPKTKESKTAPKMISNKSLFVRLPDLPINSFNTGKGSVSKILYHMPRFDNNGNEVGGLYFQPPERLYIPLNNVEKIRLNNLKVELCNIDETNGNTDLVGQTIVCLDIRRRR